MPRPNIEESSVLAPVVTQTRTSRAVAGTLTSFVQYGVLMALQFALAPVVLRMAGQEVLGAYAFLMQIIAWAALTDLGFGVATSRYLAQAHGLDDDHRQFCTIVTMSRTFYLASNAVFALLVFVLGTRVSSLMAMSPSVAAQARSSLFLLGAWILLRTPVAIYSNALTSSQNMAANNIIVTISGALRLLLSLGLVLAGAGLVGMMVANIAAEASADVAQWIWYRRLYPKDRVGWGFSDRVLFRELFRFGLTFMIMIVASMLGSTTDRLIAGYLYGAAAVSVLYTSQLLGTTLYQLAFKLTDNAAPALNELYARRASSQLMNAYLRLLRYSLLLAFPMALGLLAFTKYAIALWVGSAQDAGSLFTAALAAYAATQIFNHLSAIVLTTYGDIRVMSIFSVCAGIAKVALALWLGGRIGIAGVMMANAMVDVPGVIYFGPRVWRLLGLPGRRIWHGSLVPVLKANIPTLFVFVMVQAIQPVMNSLHFLLWFSAFGFAWAVGVWVLGVMPAEREQFGRYAGRFLNLGGLAWPL